MKKQTNAQLLALFAVLLVAFGGGGNSVFIKIGLKEMPLFTFNFLRFALASLTILPFLLKEKPLNKKDITTLILFSLLLTIQITLFQFGVRLTTATISTVLYVLAPIIVALLSYLLLAEKLSSQKVAGVVLGLLGAIVIILLPRLSNGAPFSGNVIGNLLIIIAVVLTAFYTVLSKRLQKKYTPMQMTAVFIFLSTGIFFFFAIPETPATLQWIQHISFSSIISIIFVGFFGTTVNYLALQYAIKHGSPLISSMSLYLAPVVTFIWAFFLLGEQLTTGLVIGALLAFAGVFLTLNATRNKRVEKTPNF